MTTHAESTNGKFGKAQPLCMQWAMTRKYGTTTTETSKIDCSRCAKQLGIAPAAKAPAKNPSGTCQCCFGTFKLPKGKLSLHGYERPGSGYIVGRCRGEGHLPFEQSCEQTKVFAGQLVGMIVSTEALLAALKAGKVEVLRKATRGAMRGTTIHVEVKKGESDFGYLLEREIAKTASTVVAMTADLKMLTEKIAGWKAVTS